MTVFRLDGRVVAAPENSSLLTFLRDVKGMRSVKDGCSPQGECGACTVLIDGHARTSCTQLTSNLAGHHVQTLAGAEEAELDRYVNAFMAADAVQCGFCIPGIICRAISYERRGLAQADPAFILRVLSPHLCRCTGYHSIVEAIADAWGAGWHRSTVGSGHRRVDGAALARGEKLFAADLQVPGVLHAAVRLTEHCRARVDAIDTAGCEATTGVVAVLTAATMRSEGHHGIITPDWPLFIGVGSETAYTGDVLALVVATSRETARDAAELIEVAYTPRRPVTDLQGAVDDEPAVAGQLDNIMSVTTYERIDLPRRETSERDRVTLRGVFTTQRVEHAFLEPEAVVAVPGDSALTVYSNSQGISDDQRQIASLVGLPTRAVEVVGMPAGGAFGGKEDLVVQGHASLAAIATGRPVSLVLSRSESLRMHTKRHPMRIDVALDADASGRICELRMDILGDAGPYSSVSAKVLERAAGHATGSYSIPNVRVRARAIRTNNPMSGAFRGFGANQVQFAIEGMIDRLAERVSLDPVQIRRLNILRSGDKFGPGQVMEADVSGLERCLERAAVQFYDLSAEGYAVGIGLGIKNTGIGNGVVETSRTQLLILENGNVVVRHGWCEMGQGVNSVVRATVAEALSIGLDRIVVESVARGTDPLAGQTTASRATAMVVGSTIAACRVASRAGLRVGETYEGSYSLPETVNVDALTGTGNIHSAFSFSAQVVAVDRRSREVERVVAVHDVGHAVDREMCKGQIAGAVHMGLGYAYSEDFPAHEDGHPRTSSLRQLGMIRPTKMPRLDCELIETPSPNTPLGIRGVGESGLIATASAAAAAEWALTGRRVDSLPMRGRTLRC